jgi:hypothetical protein
VVSYVMITLGKIASEIKQTFSHCAYYFVMDNMDNNGKRKLSKETVLRQGKGFDIIFLEWEEEKEITWEDIKKHFESQRRLEII